MSTAKLELYTIDDSKYCAKNECNMLIIAPRRYKHPLSCANGPSDIAVIVDINAEFNLTLIRWQLTPELNTVQGISYPCIVTGVSDLESSTVCTAPAYFFKSLPGRSDRCLPGMPFHVDAEKMIPIF